MQSKQTKALNYRKSLDQALREHRTTFWSIVDAIYQEGGWVQAVGGWVRDLLMDLPSKDLDVEIFQLEPERLKSILASHGQLNLEGESYGVFKLKGIDIDIGLPRRDVKKGLGYKGFDVVPDPHMSVSEAARRRDFTVNAISMELRTGQIIDPFDGMRDLESKTLSVVDWKRFKEDPLRVFRAAQFLSRFGFKPSRQLVWLAQQMEMETLPLERIQLEFDKMLLRGIQPSIGLTFLKQSGWIRYFPELERLIDCQQDREWHPEGDVWSHTLRALDNALRFRNGDDETDRLLMYSILCLNLGRPDATEIVKGKIRVKGFDQIGADQARRFLQRMTREIGFIDSVCRIVQHQLVPRRFTFGKAQTSSVKRLAHELDKGVTIEMLATIAQICRQATGVAPKKTPQEQKLMSQARRLSVHRQKESAVLQGRHLVEAGIKPGPAFRELLNLAYTIQINEGIRNPEVLLQRVLK